MAKNSQIKSRLKIWRDFVLNIIFPIECQGCGQEGSWLCKKCFQSLKLNSRQYCLGCKTINSSGRFCSGCQKNFYLNGILAATDYRNQTIARLIKNLKYRFAQDIAGVLGEIIFIFLKKYQHELRVKIFGNQKNIEEILIIPVPLHKKRQRWRGFNQSQKITESLNKRLNLKTKNYLIRKINTAPQARLRARQREKNVKNCFSWQGKKLDNKTILLVDDVATTGSTLNECAKILKQNGAKEVWGLVVASG